MGMLVEALRDRAAAPPTTDTGPASDYWYMPFGTFSSTSALGQSMTAEAALRVSAVYGCVKIIAESLAALPLFIYERLDKGKQRSLTHPIYDLLHDQPNQWQTAFEWKEMMAGHVLLRGNAYSRIVPGRRGTVDQLIPMHPDRMTPRAVRDAEGFHMEYDYREADGTTTTYDQADIHHIRGMSSDGVKGYSPVTMAREGFALAAAAESYGARFFSQNARPASILTHPGELTSGAHDRLQKNLKDYYAGLENAHGTLILEEGMSWQQVALTHEDAQFLQTRKFQVAEVARIFRVPLHKLADLEKASFSNIEQQALEFVTDCLMPWCVRWEQAIRRDLISHTTKYFAEFFLDALLRGDLPTRYGAYAVGITSGILSPNDCREKENMNPREGGDEYVDPASKPEPPAAPFGAKPGEPGQDPEPTPAPPAKKSKKAEPTKPTRPSTPNSPPPGKRPVAPPPKKAQSIVLANAERLVGRERKHLQRVADDADGPTLVAAAAIFYAAFEEQLVDALFIEREEAHGYCAAHLGSLAEHGAGVIPTWGAADAHALAALVMAETEDDNAAA